MLLFFNYVQIFRRINVTLPQIRSAPKASLLSSNVGQQIGSTPQTSFVLIHSTFLSWRQNFVKLEPIPFTKLVTVFLQWQSVLLLQSCGFYNPWHILRLKLFPNGSTKVLCVSCQCFVKPLTSVFCIHIAFIYLTLNKNFPRHVIRFFLSILLLCMTDVFDIKVKI